MDQSEVKDVAPEALEQPGKPESNYFSDLLDEPEEPVEFTSDETPGEGAEVPASAEGSDSPPEPKAAPAAVPPVSSPTQTPAEASPSAPPSAPAPSAPAEPPQVTAEQVAEWRRKYQEQLENAYKLPDDEALALQTEPEKVLPKLAARLQLQVLENVFSQLRQEIPSMMQVMQQSRSLEDQARQAFFGSWPGLSKYEKQVLEVGKMYRAANPNATPEEATERIGRMTAMALGLSEEEVRAGAPVLSASTPAPRPASPAASRVRQPVGVGGAGGPAASSPSNIYEQFAEEDRNSDY